MMASLQTIFVLIILCSSMFVEHGSAAKSGRSYRRRKPQEDGDQSVSFEEAQMFLVVLPRVLIAGSSELVCINLYRMKSALDIVMSLEISHRLHVLRYFMEFKYACVEFEIPEINITRTTATFRIVGRKNMNESVAFEEEKDVEIMKPQLETFIETDKPIYKPGQTVKFRVLSLDQNLRTDNTKVDKVWVENPSGVRVAQWLAVTGQQGLISLELPMTADPMLGRWKIVVDHNSDQTESIFEVDEYVLPKFEVNIDGPSYVVINETSVTYTICGKYTYGQPVEGAVFATLSTLFMYSSRTGHETLIIFTAETTGPTGCIEATFDISEWDLQDNYYTISSAWLNLAVEFTEIATGVMIQEDAKLCELSKNMFVVKFVGNQKYKKGLPFTGQVQVTRPDGTPVKDAVVHLVRNARDEFVAEVVTDTNGQASYTIPAGRKSTINLHAVLPSLVSSDRHDRDRFTISYETDSLNINSHVSSSDTFLQISAVTEEVSVGSQVRLDVLYTGSSAVSSRDFKFLFMSRGNIVRPTYSLSDHQRISSDRGTEYNRREFLFTATSTMSPVTKLLIYFIRGEEVIADSVTFNVRHSFTNQVEISFLNNEEKPGEETQLDISATPNSLCGVGIVDKSVYLLGGGQNTIQEKQVLNSLKKYQLDGESGVSIVKCNGPEQIHFRWMFPTRPNGVDSSAAFDDAGFMYLTNLNLETAECPEHYPVAYARHGGDFRNMERVQLDMEPIAMSSNGLLEDHFSADHTEPVEPETPRLRSYFPETWLWDLVLVNGNGHTSVNVTVPDTVTEWVGNGFCVSETDGIGISSTSRLQAFQPFFISYTLPYSVIRGETFPVKVTVFNYMTECLVIELTISESENFTLAENEERVKSTCVCGSKSASVEFNIVPSVVGSMPIEVTAESVSDGHGICENTLILTLGNAGDAIRQEILVEAEGIEQEVTVSEFFCPSDSLSGFIWTLDLQPPADIVPDTLWGKISFSGDVMGTTFSNLDNLLRVPYGCGEQNMLTFVPNVLAMQYLTATDQLTPDVVKQATDNMKLGYQREFNYRHGDGSFSAFGENDDSGSSWLTAYVVRSFHQAQDFIEVDVDDLARSVNWLKNLQVPSGCFRSEGRLCHKDMLGAINNDLTLSAYIVSSLLEAGIGPQDDAIVRGVECLENHLDVTDDTYALSQIAYAFALAGGSRLEDVLEKLEDRAVYEGSKHWVSNREATTSTGYHQPSSADVEMTAYVLMTYLKAMSQSDAVAYGLPVSKWLVQRRNANGGFGSTQDTVVGMTALSRFAEITAGGDLNITVTVDSSQSQTGWGMYAQLKATTENQLVLQQLYMENIPTNLDFLGSGIGCALLQVSSFYNIYPEEPELPEFNLLVTIQDHPQFVDCTRFTVTACASYTNDDGASNMAVIDFRLQSGYAADKFSLDLLKYIVPSLKRYELDGKSVLFYFDEITSEDTCVMFSVVQDIKVKDTKPAFVTVYDYYKTDVKKTVTYSLECSDQFEPRLNLEFNRDGHGLIQVAVIGPADTACSPNPCLNGGTCDLQDEEYSCTCTSSYHGDTCDMQRCPMCEDNLPLDWVDKYCRSSYVASFKPRSRNRVKMLENFRHGRETMDHVITYSLNANCTCDLEETKKYIIFTDLESVDLEGEELSIDETSLIIPFKGKTIRQFVPDLCQDN